MMNSSHSLFMIQVYLSTLMFVSLFSNSMLWFLCQCYCYHCSCQDRVLINTNRNDLWIMFVGWHLKIHSEAQGTKNFTLLTQSSCKGSQGPRNVHTKRTWGPALYSDWAPGYSQVNFPYMWVYCKRGPWRWTWDPHRSPASDRVDPPKAQIASNIKGDCHFKLPNVVIASFPSENTGKVYTFPHGTHFPIS